MLIHLLAPLLSKNACICVFFDCLRLIYLSVRNFSFKFCSCGYITIFVNKPHVAMSLLKEQKLLDAIRVEGNKKQLTPHGQHSTEQKKMMKISNGL